MYAHVYVYIYIYMAVLPWISPVREFGYTPRRVNAAMSSFYIYLLKGGIIFTATMLSCPKTLSFSPCCDGLRLSLCCAAVSHAPLCVCVWVCVYVCVYIDCTLPPSSNDEVDLIKWWGGSQRASNDEPHPLVSHAPLKLVCVVSPISFGSLVSLIHIYIYCVSFFLLLCLVWQFLIVFIAFSNFLFYCRIVVLCTFVKVKNWLYLLSLIFPDLRRWISSLFWIIYIWLRLYISTIIGRTLW
jgi:hypothetical protein